MLELAILWYTNTVKIGDKEHFDKEQISVIFQAISMAVQRGNVQCVQGAYGELAFEELDEIFYIVKPNNIF